MTLHGIRFCRYTLNRCLGTCRIFTPQSIPTGNSVFRGVLVLTSTPIYVKILDVLLCTTWSSQLGILLQVQGDTGIRLQYTHCRLYSLEKNSGAFNPKKIAPQLILEPEATILIRELARFQEILYRSNEQLEACLLVTYLFHLWQHIPYYLQLY